MRVANSIVLRTSLLFALLTAGVIALMGVVVRIAVDHHFKEMDDQQLSGKLELIRNALANIHDVNSEKTTRDFLQRALTGHHDLQVLIYRTDGKLWQHFGEDTAHVVAHQQSITDEKPTYRELQADTAHGYRIKLILDVSQHQYFFAVFERELVIIGASGLILMALLGVFVTRRGLTPLTSMTELVAGISGQQLDGRLDSASLPIELRELAAAFNAMLDRLQDSVTRLADFSSDIAHELRTPINNLLMQTQVSLSKPRSADDYREVLYASLEEYERLAKMIADMLFLAKADHGLITAPRELVDLKKEICSLCEFYGVVAEEKSVQLLVQGEGICRGDALMLRRALGNVLSNAILHATISSQILIRILSDEKFTSILMANDGDTINKEQLPRLFDRFYQADASRRRNDQGVGLGLAITHSIVQMHGGHIVVSSAEGKTTFAISLPR